MCGSQLGTSHRFGQYADHHAKDPNVFKRQSGEFTAYRNIESVNRHVGRAEIKNAAGFVSAGPFNIKTGSSPGAN